MSKRFTPLHDQVAIKLDPKKEKEGLIHIPDKSQDTALIGTVRAVGRGRVSSTGKVIEPQVKVGDRVLIQAWAPNRIDTKLVMDEEVTLLSEQSILGILENE